MSKLVQAFLSGIFFTYFIDFFFFLGIKINYIDFYEIALYYNILFADNQNIFIYLFFTIIIGYLVIYLNALKIKIFIVGTLMLLSFSTMIQPIGYSLGKILFMQSAKEVRFETKDKKIEIDYKTKTETEIFFQLYNLFYEPNYHLCLSFC